MSGERRDPVTGEVEETWFHTKENIMNEENIEATSGGGQSKAIDGEKIAEEINDEILKDVSELAEDKPKTKGLYILAKKIDAKRKRLNKLQREARKKQRGKK